MQGHGEHQARVGAVYDAAADHFDAPENAFWDRFGRRTVERLGLRRGARVLDVCCGSGASAIPAAEAVGPEGHVQAVDLAESLLELGRAKAARLGLRNVAFERGDMLDLRQPPASFDAVLCVFGVFFAPDMEQAARDLWHRVRPGGLLAVTTWGPRFAEPMASAFWDAVRGVRPELYKGFNAWDRLTEPERVASLLASAGAGEAEVVAEPGRHPLGSPDDWWQLVLGSGYRGTIDLLDARERETVRRACDAFAALAGVDAVEMNAVYAVASR